MITYTELVRFNVTKQQHKTAPKACWVQEQSFWTDPKSRVNIYQMIQTERRRERVGSCMTLTLTKSAATTYIFKKKTAGKVEKKNLNQVFQRLKLSVKMHCSPNISRYHHVRTAGRVSSDIKWSLT